MHGDLTIDRNVRDWVFIPLTVVIVLMNVLRNYAHVYMNMGDSSTSQDLKDIREQQVVARSKRLRATGRVLTHAAFCKRQAYFVAKGTGLLQQEVQSANMQEKLMADPTMMTSMMTKQLTGTVPHLAMGFLVNQFFAGFIMGKVPFTLTPRFRAMLQRGIDMASLDVSYFTSLSFYILLLFGLRGLLSLLFSGDVIDEAAVMKQSMGGGASAAFDAKTEFAAEAQKHNLVQHAWVGEEAEQAAIKVLQQSLGSTSKAKDD